MHQQQITQSCGYLMKAFLLPLSSLITSAGQLLTQFPQPLHSTASIRSIATIVNSFIARLYLGKQPVSQAFNRVGYPPGIDVIVPMIVWQAFWYNRSFCKYRVLDVVAFRNHFAHFYCEFLWAGPAIPGCPADLCTRRLHSGHAGIHSLKSSGIPL